MKKIFFLVSLFFLITISQGQILKKISDKVKNTANNKANKPIDDATNPNKDKSAADSTKKQEGQSTEPSKTETGPATLKTYSKYDFVPGEKIIVFEDFDQDAIGDFPDKWNTNASAEIVTIESLQGKW